MFISSCITSYFDPQYDSLCVLSFYLLFALVMFIILMTVLIIISTILIIFHSVAALAHRSRMPVAPCPSASAMIAATVRKVYKYMNEAVEDDNSNWKSVTDNQFSHLMSTIRRAKVDSDDSTQALAALKEHCHFLDSQLKALRASVIEATDSSMSAPGNGVKTVETAAAQKHAFLHNYLPASVWALLKNQSKSVVAKMDALTDLTHSIGLDHPSQTPTQLHMVAIVLVADGREHDETTAYSLLTELRTMVAYRRKQRCPHAVHLTVYPELVAEYTQVAPKAYAADDPPVESQVTNKELFSALRLCSSRASNKKVRDVVTPRHSKPSMFAPVSHGFDYRCQSALGVGPYAQQGYLHAARMYDQHVAHGAQMHTPTKRALRMLEGPAAQNYSMYPWDEAVPASRVPSGLALTDIQLRADGDRNTDGLAESVTTAAASCARTVSEPADESQSEDPHGLDAMIGSLKAGMGGKHVMAKPAGAVKVAKGKGGKIKDAKVVKGKGGKIKDAKPYKEANIDVSKTTLLRGGWKMITVPRGGRGGIYNMYLPAPCACDFARITLGDRSSETTYTCVGLSHNSVPRRQ